MTQKVTISVRVAAPVDVAWRTYTTAEEITRWNFAIDSWHCPSAEVDLRVGGRHTARMEARDGSMGFDFGAVYDEVEPERSLTLRLDDGRLARTTFEADGDGTRVETVFDPETENPIEMQREGWQAVLDNFAARAAANAG